MVHVNMDAPTVIGNDVTIGHNALVHGTRYTMEAGMGAILMSYSEIGAGAVIAGALISERTVAPENAVMVGMLQTAQ